ncbi:heparinase [Sphingomonas sp. Leaf339]|nr:heparinase [Sphingomonas sp. Leaf339]
MDETEAGVVTVDPEVQGIDEGHWLMSVGADKGRSLADRLADAFHKLTWRTPLHTMRLNGRFPLKLIAVPDDPVMGDVPRGLALLAGRITYRGETRSLDTFDPAQADWGTPFAAYWHSFAWLRDLSSVATRDQGSPIAERLMAQWLAVHADKVEGPAWAPDLWGRRILYWTAHAPLILSSDDLVYRSRVLDTLARGARHLDRGADKAAPGADRIAAWCGVVAAGLLIPGGEPRLAFGEAGLARAIGSGLLDDGGSVSRSPAMLLDTMMLLATLRAAYEARGIALPEPVMAAMARAMPALLGSLHGDQMLSSWQGGGPATAEHVAAVIRATGIRTRPLRQSRDWGYQRLAAGSTVLIVDAAPPPVARVVTGGCASTLAFEFSDGPVRLVVNCGGAREAHAAMPAELLEGLRSTAAHSTLTLGDSNSTAIHADGTLGRGVAQVELSRQESEAASRIEASHDGYVRRWGFLHRRQLMLTGDGRELRGEDALLPAGRKRRADMTEFALRFHLGRGVEVSPTADGQAALLRLPGGAMWQFRCRGGTLGIEDSVWMDGEGRPIEIQQLVVGGEAAAGGAHISWVLKRAL